MVLLDILLVVAAVFVMVVYMAGVPLLMGGLLYRFRNDRDNLLALDSMVVRRSSSPICESFTRQIQ